MDELQTLRKHIDQIDEQILTLFAQRFSFVKKIGEYKKKNSMPIHNKERENDKLHILIKSGKVLGISEPFITSIWKNVFSESYKQEA